MNVRRKHIRSLVQRLLEDLSISSPPVDVEALAARLGALVVAEPHVDEAVSGFLYRDPARRSSVIGVNAAHSKNRQRFTVAHEIGHLLLHSFPSIHVDKAGYGSGYGQLKLRGPMSAAGVDPEEVEANFFAAELLMPCSMVEAELARYPDLDLLDEKEFQRALADLSKRFKVSPQSMGIRLVQLDLLHVNM